MRLPSVVDKASKTVKAAVKHFSIFALAGAVNLSVADVKVAPVPWVPESGKVSTGNLTDGISFINLPQECEILIYSITYDLVKKIEVTGNITGEVKWDGKNDNNENVASGVYLWVVKSAEDKKKGKLMVIR